MVTFAFALLVGAALQSVRLRLVGVRGRGFAGPAPGAPARLVPWTLQALGLVFGVASCVAASNAYRANHDWRDFQGAVVGFAAFAFGIASLIRRSRRSSPFDRERMARIRSGLLSADASVRRSTRAWIRRSARFRSGLLVATIALMLALAPSITFGGAMLAAMALSAAVFLFANRRFDL